jgi:mycothiol synthase
VNLAVTPPARRAGAGRALAEAVLTAFADAPLTAWSHGNHPGAARLAAALGFDRVRDLWVMRRPLSPSHPLPPVEPAGGIDVRAFRPGQDEEAFLALNAEAFAGHPEQGAMTRADLDERMAEPWFDPAGFLLAERGDDLLGFHWTKVHGDGPGEIYVLGIDPDAQGLRLSRPLALAGLHSMRERGVTQAMLYVDDSNPRAVALYDKLGFTPWSTDVTYQRPDDRAAACGA